jgi:hypothetical protein
MFKFVCEGCLVALVIGSAFRFTMLAQGLSTAKLLPPSWSRWLHGGI